MPIKNIIQSIINDLPETDNLFTTFIKSYLYSPSFRVLLNYRIGKYFFFKKCFILRQIGNKYKSKLIVKRNCDISYYAHIGNKVILPHPLGIVIGKNVTIGDNVVIFQQVTLGSHGKINKELSYPIVEDNVKIYAGAKIIGGVRIGSNSIIGANAVVNIDVPANSTAYGVPCKIKYNTL